MYHVSQKSVHLDFFYNLKQLEPIFVIVGTQFSDITCLILNLTLVTYVATLPEYTLASE